MAERSGPRPSLPPPLWMLAFAGAILAVAWASPGLSWEVPGAGVLAGLLALAGVAVAVAGVAQFRRHGTTIDPTAPDRASALVTTGVFRATRNPMYLGMTAVLLGLAVWTGNAPALVVALLFVPFVTVVQIRAEEAAMRRLFGPSFDAYAARTPRWLVG